MTDKPGVPLIAPLVATDKTLAIRAFTAAKFTLIPLKGKVPSTKKWPDTPFGKYGETELAAYNYGVILGDTVLVIDIDPRNFKPGDQPVTRLFETLGIEMPKSFTVKTGGGGLHIYLRIPKGFVCVNDLKDYAGVEFKSLGRQVVGPGSVHPDTGTEYKIVLGSPDILVDAPPELLALIKASPKNLEVESPGTGKYINDQATRERFTSYLAENAPLSVEGENGDKTAFKVAAHGRDLALPPDITWELMCLSWAGRCSPPWDPAELKLKVVNAYKYAAGPLGGSSPELDFTPMPKEPGKEKPKGADIIWDLTDKGVVKKNFVNLMNYLRTPDKRLAGLFGYNEFAARIEFANPAPWHNGILPVNRSLTDADLKLLRGYLASACKFDATIADIEAAIVNVAHKNPFHPVREYLGSLVWDKTPRLDTWLHDYCGAGDDEYTRAVSRKVLVAAVMRAYHPGFKFDHVIVLEGDQDIGKSTIVEILGGEWWGDFSVDPHNKDTIQLMQGTWFMELAEMAVTRKADLEALKAFITRRIDSVRLPYGRLACDYPRQGVMIATKNPNADGTYLEDETGNRRWWPVMLKPENGLIDFRGLKDARNQLFAEAVILAKKGERLDMDTPALKILAREVVKMRHADHPWTERISMWLETQPERDFISGRDIFLDAMGGVDKQYEMKQRKDIAKVMKALGWKMEVRRTLDRAVRGYIRPLKSIP